MRRTCRLPGKDYEEYSTAEAQPVQTLETAMENSGNLSRDAIARLRALVHDLSNSLEIIQQASYLLGEAQLEEKHKKWAKMVDAATREAARINREIGRILKSQS